MEGDITITLPPESLGAMKQFVSAISKAIDAAEAQVKAETKALSAEEAMAGALGGFGEELNVASNSGMGASPII